MTVHDSPTQTVTIRVDISQHMFTSLYVLLNIFIIQIICIFNNAFLNPVICSFKKGILIYTSSIKIL